MFHELTGNKQTLVQDGFSDYDNFGSHNYACAATGNLDAPDFMPQGSVRALGKKSVEQTMAHRDWATGWKPLGAPHDGDHAAAPRPELFERMARGLY